MNETLTPPAESSPPRGPAAWWRGAVVAAYMLVLYVASSRSTLPKLPWSPSDKLLHFAAYAVLSLLVVWAVTGGRWQRISVRVVLLAALVAAAYGFTDEVHQRFVPGRDYSLADLAADALGGLTAGVAAWAWGILSRGSDRHDAV